MRKIKQKVSKTTLHGQKSVDNKGISCKAQDIFFTKAIKDNGNLTKNINLVNGSITRDASECRMSTGIAQTGCMNPEQFASWLPKIKSNQALIHGVSVFKKARILSKDQLKIKFGENPQKDENGLPIISRTKDFFQYPDGPGLLMLDHDKVRENAVALDPDKALKGYTPEELITIIADCLPAIKETAQVSNLSTSSCIYNADTGEELRGKSAGFHLYLFPE
ncbi:MAG: hypothetical protein D3906_06935, partial [Candidatus Electrothrix sp. AUS1_2]|nr:hypothetical protein [Candidatus Electrothrix sp. AUS1_2]